MESASNEDYFRSYEDIAVHELMIKDAPRTEAYRKAIEEDPTLLQGKVVMDIGAGTGILSLFAARAGARKVYAIEASSMAKVARQIVQDNSLGSVIEVIESRVEDLQLPEGEKVDVIISEWMGFYLLHESMLNSVVHARDRFLKPEGRMFPSSAQIYAAIVSMDAFYEEKVHFWQSVYGFNLSSVVPLAQRGALATNVVVDISSSQVLSTPFLLADLDLQTVRMEDLEHLHEEAFFSTTHAGTFHAFCLWFDVGFPSVEGRPPVVLSTAPDSPSTHWKQFIISMPEPMSLESGTCVEATFNLTQDTENPRFYNVSAQLTNVEAPTDESMSDTTSAYVLPGHEPQCECAKCQVARAFLLQAELDEEVDLDIS